MSDDPSKTLPAVGAMREDWAIVDPLMGGTRAMREAGEQLLPKWPKEEDCDYQKRLSLSTLIPAYSETIKNNAGRVFAEPITIGEDVPPKIKVFIEDIDRQGNNLQVWSDTFFTQALSHGLCHALAEYPNIQPQGEGELVTLADAQAVKARPYVIMIRPQQVIGWRSSNDGGEHVLTQFRYMESVEEEDGEFGVKEIKQIRVLLPGAWKTYREKEDDKGKKSWMLHKEGRTSLSHIPLTTYYTKRKGFMTAEPPLLELAHLNVKHWRSQSDQDNILHVARVPMLAISGIDDDTWELKVGTASATKLPTNGKMEWVEHTGKSIEAGQGSLDSLEDQMRIAGAKLVEKEKSATKTVFQAEDDAAQELSPLKTMAGQLEDAIDQILQFFAELTGAEKGGHVTVNGNFDSDYIPEISIPALIQLNLAGKISDETLFSELQRRNVVSKDIKWAVEQAKIAEQGPSLGTL
jgi:hypothetical protein